MITTEAPLVVALEPTELACRDCGRRVGMPIHTEKVLVRGRERIVQGSRIVADTQLEIDTVRCSVCSARRRKAESLLNTYPAVRFALGSRSFAVDKMDNAFAGLDALGVSQKTVDRLLGSERLVRALVDELAPAGRAAQWVIRFAPIWSADSDIQTCAATPWRAVDPGVMQKLRDGLAKVLWIEQDRPEDWVCPSGTGCLLCGVHSVRALRSAAQRGEVWSGIYSAQPGVLGGVRRPEDVRGYCCNDCSEAIDEVGGAMGMAAVERAIGNYLGVGAMGPDSVTRGLRAWVAMPKGTPPNETPWAHEPDHDEIKKLIKDTQIGTTVRFV